MTIKARLPRAAARGAKRLSLSLLLALLTVGAKAAAAPILVDVQPELGAGSPLSTGSGPVPHSTSSPSNMNPIVISLESVFNRPCLFV